MVFDYIKELRKCMVFISYLLFIPFEGADDTRTCLAITIGVDGLGHLLVGCGIVKEGADFVDNLVVVGSNEMDCAALQCFGTLGGVTHDENGLAKTGCFFLDATAVGEDDGGFLHEIDELQVLEWFDEKEIVGLSPTLSC